MEAATRSSQFLLVKDLWGQVEESHHATEPNALAAAQPLWCCWVLFRAAPEALTELTCGGIGFAHGSIRKGTIEKHARQAHI